MRSLQSFLALVNHPFIGPSICIAHTIAIILHDKCAICDPHPNPPPPPSDNATNQTIGGGKICIKRREGGGGGGVGGGRSFFELFVLVIFIN